MAIAGMSLNTYANVVSRYSELNEDDFPFVTKSISWGNNPVVDLVNEKTGIAVQLSRDSIHITIPELMMQLKIMIDNSWVNGTMCAWYPIMKVDGGYVVDENVNPSYYTLEDELPIDTMCKLFKPWMQD